MGGNTRRKSFRWLGDGIVHAVILKGGTLSGRTICGLESKGLRQPDKTQRSERCSSCQHSISHNVLTEWVKP